MSTAKTAKTIRAAICHVAPVFLNAKATTQKAVNLIHEASRRSANLVVFPESFIPAFPVWSALQAPHQNHDFFHRMVQESIAANGPELTAISDAAKQANVVVNIGFSEKSPHSTATLYNSNILFDPHDNSSKHSGIRIRPHRKLMPTFFEKLTWSPGDGAGLVVQQTKFGNIGALICGENTNPLARYALMTQAEQIHISTWPAIWPTRVRTTSENETPDQSSSSKNISTNYDNISANRIRAAAHCFEAKCFGIVSAGYLSASCKEVISTACTDPKTIRAQLDAAPQAASMFIDPTGALIPGSIYDERTDSWQRKDFLQNEEGTLYADLDLEACVEGKQYHDVTGGYQRMDVFEFRVDRRRKEPAVFVDDDD